MRKVSGVRDIFVIVVACLMLASCMAGKKAKGPGAYAIEQDVPQVVAVLPAIIDIKDSKGDDADAEDGAFVGSMARSVLHNHLAGKGFQPILASVVDRKLHDNPEWKTMKPAELCKLLGTQGVVYLNIHGWAMVNIAAMEDFMLSAGATLYDAGGRKIGTWTETSEKRDVSIPTSVIGLIGTVVGALLSDSPKKQFRHVAYDWGWKMAQVMPDCTQGQTLPEIMLVDSNVDVGIFGAGQKVAVKVFAEKDLLVSFDIGDFKKNIRLKMVGEGEYEGFYVVREGDTTKDQLLTVRVARTNGAEREWTEAEALITLDGVLPKTPEKEIFKAQADGVHMTWQLPVGEEVVAFVVERNDSPVGEFVEVARTQNAAYVDGEVEQGRTYYYRIRAVDKARNLSAPAKPNAVVMPRFDELTVSGDLSGALITGKYRVEGVAVVPAGKVLTIMRGTRLTFAEGGRIDVQGELVVKGDKEGPVSLSGEKWGGISVLPEGTAKIVHASFAGCSTAIVSRGRLLAEGLDAKGAGGDGLVLSSGLFELTDVDLSGWARGVVVNGGEGVLAQSTLTGNKAGLAYVSGELALDHNNIHGNDLNIAAEKQLAVRENYLGSNVAKEARVSEMVILKSVLDAPYPDGRIITLMEDADLSAEDLVKRFEEHKKRGVELFNQRKYGDAYVQLIKALRYKADRDTYLYLAYTQMELGEEARAQATMEKAIEAFPYDFRLYQTYVRYLLGKGHDGKAVVVVDKALKMNPDDENLKFLREYVVEEVRKMRSTPGVNAR